MEGMRDFMCHVGSLRAPEGLEDIDLEGVLEIPPSPTAAAADAKLSRMVATVGPLSTMTRCLIYPTKVTTIRSMIPSPAGRISRNARRERETIPSFARR